MAKYVFEEINNPDFFFFFYCDYMDNIYIMAKGCKGVNGDEYREICEKAEELIGNFNDVEDGLEWQEGIPLTYEMAFADCGFENDIDNPEKLDQLIKWYMNDPNTDSPDDIAEFLTITTGESWEALTVCGYCQGDWCNVVYKTEELTEENAHRFGELFLGCGKEFCLLDDDGFGGCSGYYVADSETRCDEDYKKVLCDMEGCSPEETEVRIISGYHTVTSCEYKTI